MVKPNRLTGLVKRRRILITIRSKNKHSSLRSATATEVCTRAKRESTGWRENDVHLVHFDHDPSSIFRAIAMATRSYVIFTLRRFIILILDNCQLIVFSFCNTFVSFFDKLISYDFWDSFHKILNILCVITMHLKYYFQLIE